MRSFLLAVMLLLSASGAVAQEFSWRAVLVAGDGEIRVFDNATRRMAVWLQKSANVAQDRIARLSASAAVVSRGGLPSATIYHVAKAITEMKPAAGEACLLFVTSHGLPREGVALSWNNEILGPRLLDRLLAAGCGEAPTVAIVSACFSGNFVEPPMARDNRIIFTAARADRPSFGCGAGDVFTYFDQCLLSNLSPGARWVDVFDDVRACVKQREARGRQTPSEPRVFVGARVGDLTLPR